MVNISSQKAWFFLSFETVDTKWVGDQENMKLDTGAYYPHVRLIAHEQETAQSKNMCRDMLGLDIYLKNNDSKRASGQLEQGVGEDHPD